MEEARHRGQVLLMAHVCGILESRAQKADRERVPRDSGVGWGMGEVEEYKISEE